MNLMKAVEEFHVKFGHEYTGPPRILSEDENKFRAVTMFEEWQEYCDAVAINDREEILDALVDLVYFACGTAYLHGFDFNEAFRRVHEANMGKVRAERDSDSKRGSALDVVKPDGWQPPQLGDLV